jgi:hypothetical protein
MPTRLCPHCGDDSLTMLERRVWSTAEDPDVFEEMKAGTWGLDWCETCKRVSEPQHSTPLITHIPEFKLQVMIVNEDGPDWVDVFHELMNRHADIVPGDVFAEMLQQPFQIVVGVDAFYELLRGVSTAPRNMRYFPASYQSVGPPQFSVSPLKRLAKEYENAGKVAEGLAMFDRLAGFPAGDAEYLHVWASMAMKEGQFDLAASLVERAEVIERQTGHAWQVVIPQLSKMQSVSRGLEPPILKAAMIDRFRRNEPEWQLTVQDLARVAGAMDREIVTANRLANENINAPYHRRAFRDWVERFGSPLREELLEGYKLEDGSLDV